MVAQCTLLQCIICTHCFRFFLTMKIDRCRCNINYPENIGLHQFNFEMYFQSSTFHFINFSSFWFFNLSNFLRIGFVDFLVDRREKFNHEQMQISAIAVWTFKLFNSKEQILWISMLPLPITVTKFRTKKKLQEKFSSSLLFEFRLSLCGLQHWIKNSISI